jgi:hypothetical protein
MAFGTDVRITNNLEVGAVVRMAGCTRTFHGMTDITADFRHFAALFQKSGALNH